MTENLLQKLEEKTMNILTEVEKLRSEIKQLKHENFSLRSEKETNTRKLQDLMGLLDATSHADSGASGERVFLQEEANAA
jgi:regulator of replication initiation timing